MARHQSLATATAPALLAASVVLAGCLLSGGPSPDDGSASLAGLPPAPDAARDGGGGDTREPFLSDMTSPRWEAYQERREANGSGGCDGGEGAGCPEEALRMAVGEREPLRFWVAPSTGEPVPNVTLRIEVPGGLRVVEGPARASGTLPGEGVTMEVVVEAVEVGDWKPVGRIAWEGRDASDSGDFVSLRVVEG